MNDFERQALAFRLNEPNFYARNLRGAAVSRRQRRRSETGLLIASQKIE